jgi:hypothetical protein
LFPIVNLLNDYPCPDPTFQPGPGQSLQDFLTEGARAFVDQASSLEADVDGVSLQSLTTYRATTSLFTFTGDPSLTAVLDPCITGSPQPGVSDGYWIMLAPLSAGTHTIHFRGVVTFQDGSSFATEVTYRLKVGA